MTDFSSSSGVCPDCEVSLPDGSPQGLCPSCLLRQAFASRTLGDFEPGTSPPPKPEEIADRFPQFEISECLGRGGMGVVYKARQKSLDRWVAIKILAPEKVGEEKFAERFVREAQTLAQLNHPNIVTVFDYGETEGLYYIVMEFIDGVNLRDLLADGKMESAQALTIVPPICEALQFAHDKGIVHRDIKPENLLIDRDGRVKIADFGIASLIGAAAERSGTPPYMAPEQGVTSQVDHRADIYALGAVLYEMLTGSRPNSPLDLPSQKVQLDIRIDDIVLRALSQEPERRYRTANEFRTVVEGVTPTKSSGEVEKTASSLSSKSDIDPRFGQGVGIAIMIAGAFNGLSTLVSLLFVPVLAVLSHSPVPYLADFPLQNRVGLFGEIATLMIVLSVIYALVISGLCLIGGSHMYRGSSRNWAFIGAVACCLTALWWPLGLILGVGAIILLMLDRGSRGKELVRSDVVTTGPRLSYMAVGSCVLVVIAFWLLLSLVFFSLKW